MKLRRFLYGIPEWFGLLSRMLCLYPIWVTAAGLAHPYENAEGLYCAVLLLAGLLTACINRYCPLRRSRVFRVMVLCAATAGGFLLCRAQLGTLCAVVLSAVTALYGNSLAEKEPDDLYEAHAFIGFLTLETASLILLHMVKISVSMPFALCLTAYQAIVFLLLRNHYHLLRLVNRRSAAAIPVPEDIRRANLRLILLLIGAGAVIFLLRAPLIALLELLLAGGKQLLALIGRGLVSLIHFLGGSAPEDPSSSDSAEPMSPSPLAEGNPLWSLLLLLVIPMVIFIWKVLFSGYLRELLEALRQRMANREQRSGSRQQGDTNEYEDFETFCGENTERNAPDSQRRWKKAYRQWKKLPDTEEKLQKGYALLMSAPAWGDAQPLPPDTPREILQKGRETLPAAVHDPMTALTEDYQQTRYGRQPMPPRTLGELEQLLQTAAARPTAHRKDG